MQDRHEHETRRLPGAIAPGPIPIETFNPLLRSLLTWGLVEHVEGADGCPRWVLIEEVQERLDALTPPPREAPASLAYLDHLCGRCREQRLTHLIDGRFLCERCERTESEGDLFEPEATRPRPESGHRRHR